MLTASTPSSLRQTAIALCGVAPSVGVEHVLDLREHEFGHVLDAAHHLLRSEFAVEHQHALGDVLGEIADPFEIVGNAQRADDLAQIDRHRLAARNGEDHLFLDLALKRIDLRVAGDHLLGEQRVAPIERVDGVADLLLGEAAHLGDHAREILQIGVERLHRVFGNHRSCSRPRRPLGLISRTGR